MPQNARLQATFLDKVLEGNYSLTVFLVNGVKLTGDLVAHDNFCLLLSRDQQMQLIYKHAVSTVIPSSPLALYGPNEE